MGAKPNENECKCFSSQVKHSFTDPCGNWMKGESKSSQNEHDCNSWMQQQSKECIEDVVCTKKNCPASIQLQAMISQLLGIQSIISSTITRLLLKKIPGSNITNSVEDIMERAKRF